ncbi:hypothetical protein K8I61_14790 [bacterium]|nr:hypothetical protein [bacterium]
MSTKIIKNRFGDWRHAQLLAAGALILALLLPAAADAAPARAARAAVAASIEGEGFPKAGWDAPYGVRHLTLAKWTNVTELEDFGGDWECATPGSCVGDYFEFMESAVPFSKPISQARLDWLLDEKNLIPLIEPGPFTQPELRKRVIDDGLNMRFLLDGLETRALTVTRTAYFDHGTYTESTLLFEDPWVGQFRVVLMRPKTNKKVPAIMAVHGHGQDAWGWIGENDGKAFVDEGYALAVLDFRAIQGDSFEVMVSENMLLDGFAFYTLRTYETLLLFKYLRYRDDIIDEKSIGLIGHSSGSMASNLTVRIEPRIAAYVSDNEGTYLSEADMILDDTAPGLYVLHPHINDPSTTSVPTLEVPYGYEGARGAISAFFDQHL